MTSRPAHQPANHPALSASGSPSGSASGPAAGHTAATTRFDDLLGFDDLAPSERERVLSVASWAEAVVLAIGFLHGDRASVSVVAGPEDRVAVLVCAGRDTCYATAFDAAAREWPTLQPLLPGHTSLDGHGGEALLRERRAAQVTHALDCLFEFSYGITSSLRDTEFTEPRKRVLLQPLVEGWWAERLGAGMTAEAAWTMLRLLLRPDACTLLAPPVGQAPPTHVP